MGSPNQDSGQDLGRDAGAVGYTATIVAAKRVLEQHNPQPLVTDPYAQALVGAEPEYLLAKWETVARNQGISLAEVLAKRTRYVAVRTRFFDEAIQAFVSRIRQADPNQRPQVVLLGAGLDTRALRLSELAQGCCYEIDRPEVLAHKQHCLQTVLPQGILHRLAADLNRSQDWLELLKNQGWKPQSPTFWLLEGVLMYLTEPEAVQLVQGLAEYSDGGSVLGLDGVRSGSIRAAQDLQQQAQGRVVRHWQFGHDRPQAWLQTCGWSAQIFRPSQLPWAKSRYPAHVPESPEMGGYDSERGVWLALADRARCE